MSSNLLQSTVRKSKKTNPKAKFYYGVMGAIAIIVGLTFYAVPVFLSLFPGSQVIMAMLGLVSLLVGSALMFISLLLYKRLRWGIPITATTLILAVAFFAAWLRTPNETSPLEIFFPIAGNGLVKRQMEFGLGIALTFAAIFLGTLVSCTPYFRAFDLPENIEKQRVEEIQAKKKKWASTKKAPKHS